MSEFIVNETGYPGAIKQEIVGELVRCRECLKCDPRPILSVVDGEKRYLCSKWCNFVTFDDYCSYGARKDG